MPSVLIEVRKQYSRIQEIALMKEVHLALQEAFKTKGGMNVRLLVHEPHRFACPENKEKPELYMHITIDCLSGRSLEAKRNLYRIIVEKLEVFEIPRDHVKILLRETISENWGIRGGQAACDVDLGFRI